MDGPFGGKCRFAPPAVVGPGISRVFLFLTSAQRFPPSIAQNGRRLHKDPDETARQRPPVTSSSATGNFAWLPTTSPTASKLCDRAYVTLRPH